MVKVMDLKNIDGEVTHQIIDFLIKKYLSDYSKKDIVIWYLCEKSGYDFFDYHSINYWWESDLKMNTYIEYFIPRKLRPIYVKKMYEALGLDMEKEEYEESLLHKIEEKFPSHGFLDSYLNFDFFRKNLATEEEAKMFFGEKKYELLDLTDWEKLKKKFERYLINNEIIPEDINTNKELIDNSESEENRKSLYENIPNEKEYFENDNSELDKLFPIKDNTKKDEEIFDKYYKEAVESIEYKIYNDEKIGYYTMDDIQKLYNRLTGYSIEMLYHELYSIIESLCKYDEKYDYNEIKELAKNFDLLEDKDIYDEGLKLLKTDVIKYILIIRQMNNTKNAAYLRFMFNVIYDDMNFVDNDEDVHKLIHRTATSNNLEFRLNYGLDVNSKNHHCDPIIFNMYTSRFSTKLSILRNYNYNFDLEDHNGNNYIMHIIKNYTLDSCHDFISEMLKTNFDIYHKNKNRETLLDLFLQNPSKNNKELIPIFEELYGIRINDVDVEFNNKLKEVEEKIKVYKK